MWPLRPGMIAGRCALDSSGSADAAATTAFLARTSGLDGTHTTAYKNFINGIVSDGIIASFDAIYIIATQDIATARLNIVQNNFNLTGTGMTFVADRGATDAGGSSFFTTGFTPSTASGQYALNSAHLSMWTNGAGANRTDMGWDNGGAASGIGTSSGNSKVAINQTALVDGFSAVPDGTGFFWAQRTASNALAAYTRSSSAGAGSVSTSGTGTTVSTSLTSGSLAIGVIQGQNYSGRQISAVSIGASLSAADVQKYFDRLRTFMTAVGN